MSLYIKYELESLRHEIWCLRAAVAAGGEPPVINVTQNAGFEFMYDCDTKQIVGYVCKQDDQTLIYKNSDGSDAGTTPPDGWCSAEELTPEERECCETGMTVGPGTYTLADLVAASPGVDFINWIDADNSGAKEITLERLGNTSVILCEGGRQWGKEDGAASATDFTLTVPAGGQAELNWSYVKS